MICMEPMVRNLHTNYWHMICLHHMLRSLHTEFLTDDLFGTYVKTCTQRIPDRWYVWNICEDLCTESSWLTHVCVFWRKLVVHTKCHFLSVSVVSVTIQQKCICRSVWETQWKNRTFPKVAKPSTFHRHPRRNYTHIYIYIYI